MAEALLRHRLTARGIDGHVRSAGLMTAGEPVTIAAVQVMSGYGVDVARHRSGRLDRALEDTPDLVLGMGREHVGETVTLRPDLSARAFTLKELVRLGEAEGPRAEGESVEAYLARLHGARSADGRAARSLDDDIADPIGLDVGVYERTAAELDDLVTRFVALVWR